MLLVALPTVRLQIVQQRNLLFQFIDRLSVHELFTSTGRIRRTDRVPIPGKDGGRAENVPRRR
jgi:hypothetical protein